MSLSYDINEFGTLPDGGAVRLFTLNSGKDCVVKLCEFGAAITSVHSADRKGDIAEICLGYDTLESHIKDTQSIGVTVGRYANRIANSQFDIAGKTYSLDANIPPHQIHGGAEGFGKQMWQGKAFESSTKVGVTFQRKSPDGECGYPGNLDVSVTYSLSDTGCLSIEYEAMSDTDTFVNLTNHAYFNLSGATSVIDHEITIYSDKITPLNDEFLAVGDIKNVGGTPFDLCRPTRIGDGLQNPDTQMQMVGGYDINYILGCDDGVSKKAAQIVDPTSGRSLTVNTTQPCLQFYTGNNLEGTPARDGSSLSKYAAFCLEAQDYPNGPNVNRFPTHPLAAGETYHQRIDYIFGCLQ